MAACQSPLILESHEDKANNEQIFIAAQSSPSLSTQPSDSPNSKSFESPVKPVIANLNQKRKASALSSTNVVKAPETTKEYQSQVESAKESDCKQSEVILDTAAVFCEKSKIVIGISAEDSKPTVISQIQSTEQEQSNGNQEKVESPNLDEKVLLKEVNEKTEEIEPAPKKKQRLENLERGVNYIMLGALVGVILFRTSFF